MEINKKDLRKLSRAFRTISNRTIHAHFQEVDSIIHMFIDYIHNNSLILSYINSISIEDFDVAKETQEVLSSYGRAIFYTGSSAEEEIAYTYKILKHLSEQEIRIVNIAGGYAHSTKYQDMVKGFGERVVLPFVNHIETYLTDIAIDMGFDEEEKYMISINGGQVNIAKDQATINATQYNGINASELEKLIQCVKSSMTDSITLDVREIINDNIEVLGEELRKENPKKGFIKTAISGLQGIIPKVVESIELTAAITSIIQFAIAII